MNPHRISCEFIYASSAPHPVNSLCLSRNGQRNHRCSASSYTSPNYPHVAASSPRPRAWRRRPPTKIRRRPPPSYFSVVARSESSQIRPLLSCESHLFVIFHPPRQSPGPYDSSRGVELAHIQEVHVYRCISSGWHQR